MRPVDKGNSTKVYIKYTESQNDLTDKLGRGCSYCERWIASAINVEHKKPKSKYPSLEYDWKNFLLSCPNCNSSKGHRKIRLGRYIWPDSDNTFLALKYDKEGFIKVNKSLPKKLRRVIQRTIQLLGLNKHLLGPYKPTDRDNRWQDRREEWRKAKLFKNELALHDTPNQRQLILDMAKSRNIFSIWMQVFEGNTAMRKMFIDNFKGTAINCFDPNTTKEINRPGGKI
jgi:uncharacterized protein (TIGR02646 family)